MRVFFLLFLFISGAVRAQNCMLKLSGHVTDADSKDILIGATVKLSGTDKWVVTDDKGNFTFDGLCAGEYQLEVSHVDCKPTTQSIALQQSKHIDVSLPHARNALEAVVVEAQKAVANTGFKKELSGVQLEETRGQSLAEALGKITGVSLLQTGATVSKPVIHGLHSNRILTINNGVRQEGQQWGNEHAPEIDPFIADELVVIKGVDELKYGSDAIGGVILVNPRPLKALPGYYGEINLVGFSNNQEYVTSLMFEHRLKSLPAFGYRIQGTFKQGGNVNTPHYRLNNTAIREQNFSLTAGWKKTHYSLEAFYSQFQTKVGVFTGSHVGNLTDLENAIAADQPADVYLGEKTYSIDRPFQEVLHRLFKLKSDIRKGGSKFDVQFAAQYNHRKEYDRARSSSSQQGPQMDLGILTLSEQASWEHPAIGNLHGSVGVAAMQQDNSYHGRYFIPNYNSSTWGAFWIEKWSKNQWELQGGIRYDRKHIDTKRIKSDSTEIAHDFNFETFAASFNTAMKIGTLGKVNLGITLANRAPYVNELLSDGIHHGTATYEQGDINLVPERSVNVVAGFAFHNQPGTFTAELTLYNNEISHFIYQQPEPDEPVLTIAGAFPKLVYEQTDARLQGIDVTAGVTLLKPLTFTSKVALLRAWNKDLDDWLIRMPSDRWSNGLTWTLADKGRFSKAYVSAEVSTVFEQTRVPDETVHGRQDYKEPPPGYSLLNATLSSVIRVGHVPLTVALSGKNILNTAYREYLDGFRYFTDEMGRNISLRVKIPFEKLF